MKDYSKLLKSFENEDIVIMGHNNDYNYDVVINDDFTYFLLKIGDKEPKYKFGYGIYSIGCITIMTNNEYNKFLKREYDGDEESLFAYCGVVKIKNFTGDISVSVFTEDDKPIKIHNPKKIIDIYHDYRGVKVYINLPEGTNIVEEG